MSRTDKDKPYWLGDRYDPNHDWRCRSNHRDCDLPELDPKTADRAFHKSTTRCYWQAIHNNHRTWWQAPPPKWYTDHDWNNPQRVKIRDYAREAIKEYNANGELDSTFQNEQHRHRSTRHYW